MSIPCWLMLSDGSIFKGKSFGLKGEAIGEIVFTTAMTGYIETLTDPSYFGQIVVQAFPLIGNYGIIEEDFESRKSFVSGYIVRQWCQFPSNFRCEQTIDTFLHNQNIVGLHDIDTRRLTKIIREYGVMNAIITPNDPTSNKEALLEKLKNYKIIDAVKQVTFGSQVMQTAKNSKYKVVVWDFGLKLNIVRELMKRGCDVITVPAGESAEAILKLQPDGIMLSNGPGDPAENTEVIAQLQEILKHPIPIFGICLGHQLLALAKGGKTKKLKYGHRGSNQPVKDIDKNRVYITSQNHGYAVVPESIDTNIGHVSHMNVNDNTCEGVRYKDCNVFSVQFHPEASGGPLDTSFLFDEFINRMGGSFHAQKG